jgi:SAM-dependent methyltransferase
VPYAALGPIYDTLLGDRYFPALRRAFEGLARRYDLRFDSAADVACGTGTFVRYLGQRQVPVLFGVDRSLDMLRIALRKNAGTGARFFWQDFASLALPEPVDLVTCNFDSLNYLLATGDVRRALGRFHASLRPGGHCVFDVLTGRPVWGCRGPRVERVGGSGLTIRRITHWDPRRGLQVAVVSVRRRDFSRHEVHVQRRYSTTTVLDLLRQARFVVRGVHDFTTLGALSARTRRAVYVSVRSEGGSGSARPRGEGSGAARPRCSRSLPTTVPASAW